MRHMLTQRLARPLPAVLAAVQFLTILPVPRSAYAPERTLAGSLAYFPLAGALVGALVGGADLLARGLLPAFAADVLAVVLLAVVSGALHLDGLADTSDGLFAPARSREERLAIMRDSRIGAFGVLALILLLLAKIAAIGQLDPQVRVAAFVCAGAASRWAIVFCYWAHDYARSERTLSAQLKRGASGRRLVLASLLAVGAAALLGPAGPATLAVVALAAAGLAWWIASRLGGVTGDTCGAVCEVSELLALLAIPSMIALLGQ